MDGLTGGKMEKVDWKKITEKVDKDIEQETKNFLKKLKGGKKENEI